MASPMTTPAAPDFENLNATFSALIESLIPNSFGAKSKSSDQYYGEVETAEKIIERNKALRSAEHHRKIIAGGTVPGLVASLPTTATASSSTLPLSNALKRKTTDPSAISTNGQPSAVQARGMEDNDGDSDEGESRTRIVTKKSKTSRDAFSTKKQGGKVKAVSNGNGVIGGNSKGKGKETSAEVGNVDEGVTVSVTDNEEAGVKMREKKEDLSESSSARYNPFKLSSTTSNSAELLNGSAQIQPLFSGSSVTTTNANLETLSDKAVVNTPPTEEQEERTRTGMTPPRDLHGKDRKRWRKKMKKQLAAGQSQSSKPDESDAGST